MKNKRKFHSVLILVLAINIIPVFPQQTNTEAQEKSTEIDNSGTDDISKSQTKKSSDFSLEISSPNTLLGLSPEEAYSALGAPDEIFTMRGSKEWQDDAVFYFKNHIYLFWFKNRVWQFRTDIRFKGSVFGLRINMKKKNVIKILGKPFKSNNDSDIFLNPAGITRYETGFPVRMKIFYNKEKRVSDIYVYRGDF